MWSWNRVSFWFTMWNTFFRPNQCSPTHTHTHTRMERVDQPSLALISRLFVFTVFWLKCVYGCQVSYYLEKTMVRPCLMLSNIWPCCTLPPPAGGSPHPLLGAFMRQCLYIQCQNLCGFLTCKVSKSINVVRPRSFEVSESIISPLHHCPPPSHVVHLTEDLGTESVLYSHWRITS